MIIKEGKTNWKYILIVIILTAIVGGGVLGYMWWIEKQEIGGPELKIPEKTTEELDKCKDIQDLFEQGNCYRDLAGKAKSEEFCDDIPDFKDLCYKTVAVFKKDKTLCEKIETIGGKALCRAKIAEETKTYSEKEAENIIKDRATETILAIKDKDTEEISSLTHPDKGVRFSPYTYVLSEEDLVFSADQILNFFEDQETYTWGAYDGSGEPIVLNPGEYYERFIYDKDFTNAEKIGYNEILSGGNTINNTFEVYPNSIIVQYHFSGFDPKYMGMDWKSLKLAFEEKDGIWYLVGIIHDEWTI